jgi:hypothetical protein
MLLGLDLFHIEHQIFSKYFGVLGEILFYLGLTMFSLDRPDLFQALWYYDYSFCTVRFLLIGPALGFC